MKILIIVPVDRPDFYAYLQTDSCNDYILLWYRSNEELVNAVGSFPSFFFKAVYWNDFRTPADLLRKVKPDKIVFFEIIDQLQISLIIQAKFFGITTFYLEHGAAGDAATALERSKQKDAFSLDRLLKNLSKLISAFSAVVKTKYFYYSSFKAVKSGVSFWHFMTLPLVQFIYGPNKALRQKIFRERVPNYSIVFNRVNFEQFQLYTAITENEAIFTGVPMFDNFYVSEPREQDYVVYIEHPYLETGFKDWTAEHHHKIAKSLYEFAKAKGIKLFVKLHPLSNKKIWDSYGLQSNFFEVVQTGDFVDLYLNSKLILGYSSSLITGFLCAKKNVVLLAWHPDKTVAGNDFSRTKLCHLSLDVDDLNSRFDFWIENNLSTKNSQEYKSFLYRYNYPFDGKARQRVIESITGK